MSDTSIHLKNAVVVHHENTNNVGRAAGEVSSTSWTKREKTCTVLVFVLLGLVLGLAVLVILCGPLISQAWLNRSKQGELALGFGGLCDSAECVEISHRTINSGSFAEDPCLDFYNYACSNWQRENSIPLEQLYHAANINLLRDRVDTRIKNILEERKGSSEEEEKLDPVQAFYFSCLNATNPNEDTIVSDLVSSLGGYQLSDSWSDSQFDLTNLTESYLRINAAPLFDLTLDIDARNNSRYVLIVELPRATTLVPNLFQPRHPDDGTLPGIFFRVNSDVGLSGGHGNLSSETGPFLQRRKLYQMITDVYEAKRMEHLKDLIRKVGKEANMGEEELSSDINEIVMIASRIQALVPSQRTRKFWKQQNRVYVEFTLESLQGQFEGINWRRIIGDLTRPTTGKYERLDWSKVKVYVPYPDYLRKVLQVVQFTNKRLISNMMLMLYVRDMVSDLTDKKKSETRWKFCVQSTKSVFAMELSSMYLRSFPKLYLEKVKADVTEIFGNVKSSLVNFLNSSTWLENRTKEEAIRKILLLKGHFLAPSFYLKDDYLEDSVRKIHIDPTDFYQNVRLVYRLFREQLYKLYRTGVDEERATWAFVAFPFVVNAFYIQQFNSIVIPLAFLNPPQYTADAPVYVNYATIGQTIAHETLHALDGSGSGFDADGKLNDWWNEESRSFLRDKTACVANQYSTNFQKLISFYETHVPIQVDGNLTQNENLADIAGLQVAYSAYKAQRGILGAELKLPGVNQTLEQVFFLTVAQAYCANISPVGYIFLLEMDEHTPHPERINGMLMNIPEFAKAYHCPIRSPMNPEAKCTLW